MSGGCVHARGFTLLELLIAMAVFSILGVMSYAGLSAVSDHQHSLEARAEGFVQVQRALRIVEGDIRYASTRGVRDALGSRMPALQGGAVNAGLELTRSLQFDDQGSGLARIAYRVSADTLLRETWPVLDRMPQHQPIEQPLLADVERVQWRFLDNGEWVGDWPPAGRGSRRPVVLPDAIEVTLQQRGGATYRRVVALAGVI